MSNRQEHGVYQVTGLTRMAGLTVSDLLRFLQRSLRRNPQVQDMKVRINGASELVEVRIDQEENVVELK